MRWRGVRLRGREDKDRRTFDASHFSRLGSVFLVCGMNGGRGWSFKSLAWKVLPQQIRELCVQIWSLA